MNTNTIVATADGPRRSYWPSRYLEETPMITQSQKERLTALIYLHIFEDHERELRLSELEDLTQADADYALYQFLTGQWS
ncbi:MAG: hypothetical protein UU58_C0001G0011 [Candidatus Nomurabacteria bacterium GW2011_GWA2_41_25]|uniref:Uncharacterized protein n=1 Tax=Candidatus Nomurabacteria bacterium GW2011_GWA2_41_25 TaxID=1618736 RepID=A0A0G0Y6V0_9BACT|nr:MAG: hypothetical protein UU58_C0001G0011 [Candidatus Nomurabacteria bacterium GW2011_GWA2_41_25]OGI66945.1 MAG: hypothetical protein A2823_02485 [Candidatus Nomurabacteria bacterium RIFCSPHIGHO2_01_FULL_41_91]OGI80424.1 MAG: hypothetical protein A3D43_00105 [Candidatus Nomurabacteria bacterium RIFCSPHIGHO2_02_FULL_41_52]OGI94049.1 MAG: hypothetical protein A3A07_01910 [Candidatus Nomurabacteria bacterium RIFCSPLOWO2_01_FULL_41_52]